MEEAQELQVQSLGREDPLEKEMATYSSILAWRIPMDRGACQATVYGVTKSQTWVSTDNSITYRYIIQVNAYCSNLFF